MNRALHRISALSAAHRQGCTHAVMESTGVYWKPVWHLLEGHVELVLANAQHVRNMPGRKSDMNDATWLAELMAHGLVHGSFVPPEPIRELRDQTRTRAQLVGEVRRHLQRIHSPALGPRPGLVPSRLCGTWFPGSAPARLTTKASALTSISRLNPTAFALAVYASPSGSLRRSARLASGGWLAFAERDWLPAELLCRFLHHLHGSS
jgi:hypothetical protein